MAYTQLTLMMFATPVKKDPIENLTAEEKQKIKKWFEKSVEGYDCHFPHVSRDEFICFTAQDIVGMTENDVTDGNSIRFDMNRQEVIEYVYKSMIEAGPAGIRFQGKEALMEIAEKAVLGNEICWGVPDYRPDNMTAAECRRY